METTPEVKFCKKLVSCVKEYKKQSSETYDDIDAAHFYDKGLKKWLKENEDAIDQLSQIGLDKGFVQFLKHYLFAEPKE